MNRDGNAALADLLSDLIDAGGQPSELVQSVMDVIPYGLLIFGPDHRIMFANESALASFDLVNEAPAGSLAELRKLFQLIDPRTQGPLAPDRGPLARAFRGETVHGEEYMLRKTDGGSRVWIECNARPVRTASALPLGVIFAFCDITERKKRELAHDSADQLRDFVYHENLAGIIHSTVDGRIIDCNDAILRMWGYESKQELLAIRAQQIYDNPQERDRILGLIAAPGRLGKVEVCFRRKDGSRCWCMVNTRLLDAPPGEVGGAIISTVIDITERKLQEEELRQSEARFTAFMRHLPGLAFIKDLRGVYIYYNEATRTLFQMDPEDIVGKTDDQIWSPENAARYRESDASVIEAKRPLEFVEPVAHADGPHSWLIYKFPIIENGKVVLVGGVGIDITERQILEDQLNQARKMEALGRLAGGVAHDFNNLLTVISGYSQLVLEGIGSTPEDRLIAYVQEILNSSRRASSLTGQLLAFSRRQLVEPKVLDLSELLRGMQRLLQRMIGEHVDLTVRCVGEPCLICADVHQMEQVVMNLAANARDAMPLGGTLDLICERLAEPVNGPDDEPLRILLTVRDTGIGMDGTIRAQIFDPFFTSKERGKGTGLGLSTVYGIVAQSRGNIEVESTPGEGTTFRIYFPAAEGDPETTAPVKSGSFTRGREVVLLVEDEKGVRILAETILKRLGYQVLVADSGAAALRIWEQKEGRIDVLLTDVIMPQMSGGDLATRLREINPRLKVLFMSGYTDDMLANHGVLAGETQLLQKPFTADVLGRKLRDVLDA